MGQRLVDIGNRRVAQQIISLVVAGGIAPGKAGNRGGVVFFQAEDGIRDKLVTGVQTCALPIS